MASAEDPPFNLPSPEKFAELIHDLGLNVVQARELQFLLEHAHADMCGFFSGRHSPTERARLVKARKAVSQALGKLQDVLLEHQQDLDAVLPSATFQALGQAMSSDEIARALGTRMPSPGLEDLVASRADDRIPTSAADTEREFRWERETAALKHGPELFVHLVQRLSAPINSWLELNRANPGGRPPNLVRAVLISRLAIGSPAILGRQATGTAGGPFVRLCAEVLDACGVSSEGVEDAVDEVLQRMAARKPT